MTWIPHIAYKGGYKYQLQEDYKGPTLVFPEVLLSHDFISLTPDGTITIKAGYAWDGPSGPTVDTRNFMRGALVHDALYQLIREEFLHKSSRLMADKTLFWYCRNDGMSRIRRTYIYYGVRWFAGFAASPSDEKPTKYAP